MASAKKELPFMLTHCDTNGIKLDRLYKIMKKDDKIFKNMKQEALNLTKVRYEQYMSAMDGKAQVMYENTESKVHPGETQSFLLHRDLFLLQDNRNMITDNVINEFGVLLQQMTQQKGEKKIRILPNLFYTQLVKDGKYSYVERGLTGTDLFQLDVLLLPVFVRNIHWALVAAYPKKRSIYYLDSLSPGASDETNQGPDILMNVLRLFFDNHLKRKLEILDVKDWRLFVRAIPKPQQHCSLDCGVFCTMYMDCLCNDVAVDWIKQDSDIVSLWRLYLKFCLTDKHLGVATLDL